MLVKFILIMEDLVVNNQFINQVIIEWQSEMNQQKILEISHQWVTSQNYLAFKMIGLQYVGESSLTIEPLEDIPDFQIPLK